MVNHKHVKCSKGGHLFKVGACSRLAAYLNKFQYAIDTLRHFLLTPPPQLKRGQIGTLWLIRLIVTSEKRSWLHVARC